MTKILPLPQSQEKKSKSEYLKEWRLKNKSEIARKAKEKYELKRDVILARKKEYSERTKEQRAIHRRQYYAENKERICAAAAKLREGKESELAEWQRNYREKNREMMLKREREYYQKHRDKKLKSKSEWGKTEEGRFKQNVKNQRRRARKLLVENSLTAADILKIKSNSKGKCFYCSQKKKLTLDHIVPIVKGGGHTKDNVVMACKSCNSSKGPKDPIVFARERGLLLI